MRQPESWGPERACLSIHPDPVPDECALCLHWSRPEKAAPVAGAGFGVGIGFPVESGKIRNPPTLVCKLRGDRVGTCEGCGGMPKYACPKYGEVTATDCMSCPDHTEGPK